MGQFRRCRSGGIGFVGVHRWKKKQKKNSNPKTSVAKYSGLSSLKRKCHWGVEMDMSLGTENIHDHGCILIE